MKITTWPEVKAGQIVQFMYKSDGATKSYRRTVLCLDPKYRYRKKSTNRIVELFIGLELEKFGTRRPLNRIETKLLFEKLSKIEDDILGSSTAKTRMEDIYQDLRLFIEKYPVFKTYWLRECRKKRVFVRRTLKDFNRLQIEDIVESLISDLRAQKRFGVKEGVY
tara:strand:+ start:108 stop:602 length:495 start_codon:yes stop_codon:yes gene_type:complete